MRTMARFAAVFAALILMVVPSAPGLGAQPAPQAQAAPNSAAPQAAAPPAPPSGPAAIPAARKAENVAIITIDRPIDRIMVKSIARRIQEAEASGAGALVFELNTPGGELGAVRDISAMIKRSKIPNTVAWVNPMAYSGGAVIALACREIVVSDQAAMGDAAIIAMNFGAMHERFGETERQKFLGPLLLEVVSSARLRGYDERLVQGFISRGVDLYLIRNTQTGEQLFVGKDEYRQIFDKDPPRNAPTIPAASGGISYAEQTARPADQQVGGASRDRHPGALPQGAGGAPGEVFEPAIPNLPREVLSEVAQQLDRPSSRPSLSPAMANDWEYVETVASGEGILVLTTDQLLRYRLATREVNTDEELREFFGATNVVRVDEWWSERMVVLLTSNWVRGLLIVVFLVSLFIEMTHPGLILPGTVAAIALVVLIAPPFLNNMASWWEVAAILGGIALIAAEIFVLPGFGVFGVLGIFLLFGGLLGTFTSGTGGGLFPDSPQGRQDLMYGVATLVLSTATAGILGYVVVRHLGSLPIVGKMVLKEGPGDDESGGMLEAMDPAPALGVSIGAEGMALTPLRPAGRVQIGEEIVDVVAEGGFIPAGAIVRVASVGAFRTTVERVHEDPAPGEAPSAPSDPPAAGDRFA